MLRQLAFCLLLLASVPVDACRIRTIPLEERIRKADMIFVGVVSGLILSDFENANGKSIIGRNDSSHSSLGYIEFPETVSYRVIPFKPIKGSLRKPVLVECGNGCGCHGGDVKLKETALFITEKQRDKYVAYVIPESNPLFESTIKQIKEVPAQRNNRTTQ
jgi:hypothetical protein